MFLWAVGHKQQEFALPLCNSTAFKHSFPESMNRLHWSGMNLQSTGNSCIGPFTSVEKHTPFSSVSCAALWQWRKCEAMVHGCNRFHSCNLESNSYDFLVGSKRCPTLGHLNQIGLASVVFPLHFPALVRWSIFAANVTKVVRIINAAVPVNL